MKPKPDRVVPLARAAGPDCWNHQGVWGDRQCPELSRVGHCRHCSKYSEAAARMLDRPWSPEWDDDSGTATAAWAADQNTATGSASALLFRLADEWFGLPPRVFVEVAAPRPVHSLPHRRNGVVLGLVNVRGELLVCVSLHRLLDLTDAAAGRPDPTALIVLEEPGGRVAAPVDEIAGIQRFDPAQVRPAPLTAGSKESHYLRGLLRSKQGSVGLLDEERLLQGIKRHLA